MGSQERKLLEGRPGGHLGHDEIRQILDKQRSPRQRFKQADGQSEKNWTESINLGVLSTKMMFKATGLAERSKKEHG